MLNFLPHQILNHFVTVLAHPQYHQEYRCYLRYCSQVLPLLHNLYTSDSHNSHYIYMMLIILLILSQDDCFNKTIHEVVGIVIVFSNYCSLLQQMISKVPWYNARTSISQISLGSLMILVVINVMQINIAQMRVSIIQNYMLLLLLLLLW